MSRCFRYPPPPPYYEEGLIESIKKEREKAKKERRKEKKREKKEKREKAGQENTECQVHNHKKRKHEGKSRLDQNDGYNAKATTAANSVEQLEKSGLTEEHEQPCSVQNTYDSSESSQDSSKRRKLVATNVSQARHGSILRIRLPPVKQKDPIPASMPIVKQKDPTPPASMPIVKQKDPTPPASMRIVKQKDPVPRATMPTVKRDLKPPATVPTLNLTDLALTRTSEEPCFSGRVMETSLELEAVETRDSKAALKRNSRIQRMETQFRELMANWNPPPLQLEHSDMGNQDWLFGSLSSKRRSGPDANRCKASTEGLLSHVTGVPSSLQPQACYLSEFGMYQLPYVIPY